MTSLDNLIPAAFPALALAHFLALLSPGQDFFLIAGHAIRHNLRGSRFICVGVALGNAVYIAIAILGWSSIESFPTIISVIELIGAAYLLWIGWQLIRSQANEVVVDATIIKSAVPSALKQLWLGLNSALLNPKNALFYISLMAVILGKEVTLQQQAFCGLWMFLAVLSWNLIVASAIGHRHVQQFLSRKIHLFERGAGAVLISFGLGLLIQTTN
ncbi:MAG: LysE family transporter [Gammaproteobacteria bacterium]|nr:LysE family transporter [Gammaproteobacteria bacterium]